MSCPPVVLRAWGSLVTFHGYPVSRADDARTTKQSAGCRPLDASWERGRPFRLRSHSASSSARTCDAVPALWLAPGLRPLWSHSANPNQVERKAWTRVFAPLLPSCTKSAGGEQGRCSSGCPGRTRRTGNVGAGLPGLATLWVVGSRDEIGPPLFPAPSRAPAAVPDHTGHAAHLALFSNGWRSAVAQPHQAVYQLRFSSCWNTKRDVCCVVDRETGQCHGRHVCATWRVRVCARGRARDTHNTHPHPHAYFY